MSLRQANMVKQFLASGGGSLIAQAGESFRIRRIECVPSTNDTYLTVSVDRVTVAFYRVKGKAGNHLGTIHNRVIKGNLMEFLTAQGINVSIPVAEGQTLSVSRYAQAGNVIMVYDRYDAGDVKATDANGSEGKEYTFIQYAETSAVPTASGSIMVDTSLTPAEFPDFPCGKVVPANYGIELLGIAGSAVANASSFNAGFLTAFLKLMRNREVLFDPDRNGLPFQGISIPQAGALYQSAFSLIGPGVEVELDQPDLTYHPSAGQPLMFTPSLAFTAGEELNVYLTVTLVGAGTWTVHVDDEAFILRVKRL